MSHDDEDRGDGLKVFVEHSGVILYRSNVIGISHSVRERLNVCGAAVYVIATGFEWERLTPLKPRGNVGLVRNISAHVKH